MPTWLIQPLVMLGIVGILLGGIEAFSLHEKHEGAAEATATLTKANDIAVAQAVAKAKAVSDAYQTAAGVSHVQDVQRATTAAASATSARNELARLRARLASPSPAASGGAPATGPGTDEASLYRGLFEACAVEYSAVGEDAGQLAGQVIGLQGFVLALGIGDGSPPVGVGPRAVLSDIVTQPTTAPSGSTPVLAVPPTP